MCLCYREALALAAKTMGISTVLTQPESLCCLCRCYEFLPDKCEWLMQVENEQGKGTTRRAVLVQLCEGGAGATM